MTSPEPEPPHAPSSPQRLLALADLYTRLNDSLYAPTALRSTAAMMDSIRTAHRAVHATLRTADLLTDLPPPLSDVELDARTQLTQLGLLTSTAVRHLTTACDVLLAMLYNAEDGTKPVELADPTSVSEAAKHLRLAETLTALAPQAAVEQAQRVGEYIALRRAGPAAPPAVRLSPVQRAALHAIACGHIRIWTDLGKEYVSCRYPRPSLGTIRSLEARELVAHRLLPPRIPGAVPNRRLFLTAQGIAVLADGFGRPQRPRTTGPARPAPHRTDFFPTR
ncbi:hypothetical protein [Streptomyces acidiscabies]|uniref:Uncharacterized protein n=1 Tax=Streptomyces acidiscabies TaxID=42234 RepID=A0AAP6EK45_9ACTN|nr:hypothetical protein [Streptomyces acidiscabies]MBP5935450.1 hypothetical protein [Streptomyces sp. LBUM 1476]MBZ3916689.1 hypothetical protein [Streptomyces acidiscabies]MDX2965674.1 hypothetical protein [Streptomyces acidiscabies]MDX3024824.1 hypothetical protein [Streptomyces acidiscabies]MDX3795590.1 hypothetical protein [Streptomyces acidiscabies]